MLKRPHYIVLGLVVVVVLIILNLPSQASAKLKLGIGSLFLPLFGLTTSAQAASGEVVDALVPRKELLRQNEALRRKNAELAMQVLQDQEIARENARLRSLLNWERQKPWKLKLGRVVLREPSNWWRTVQIDLGSRDGVKTNMAVLTMDGLAGRIGSVSLTRSQVILLGDPNCKVSALVENAARDTGIIGASGPLDSAIAEIGYLSRGAHLVPGENVVTSGLGGIFPKGIPIGKVVDSRSADYGLNTVARVRLAVNLSALEELWVLFP